MRREKGKLKVLNIYLRIQIEEQEVLESEGTGNQYQ
jgi:hypothetical protein